MKIEIDRAAGVLARHVGSYVAEIVDPLKARIADLEAKLAVLEKRPTVSRYRGVWDEKADYLEHEQTTHGGSLWTCRVPSKGQRPGSGPHWSLSVKRGKAA